MTARPMDIPELRHIVGQYLDRKALLSCIRVSKDWHDSFIPFVYTKVDLWFEESKSRTVRTGVKMPTIRQLLRYDRNVRDLSLEGRHFLFYPGDSRLPPIVVPEEEEQDHPPTNWRWARQFVLDHPKIERLEIRQFNNTSILDWFTPACAHLKVLWLHHVTFDSEVIFKILKRSPHLDTLSICHGQITGMRDDNGFPKKPKSLPLIKSLDLRRVYGLELQTILEWMSRCPQLEEFKIHVCERDRSGDWSLFKNCPNLTKLTIVQQRLVESTLANILTACPKITELTLRGERLNEKAFKALKNLFGQLRVLNFFETVGVKSWMIGVILSECPNLVDFAAGIVNVEADGLLTSNAPGRQSRSRYSDPNYDGPPTSSRPWACTRLRRIRFKALDWSEDDAVNDKFLDQRLAALKELEEFSIGEFDDDDDDVETVKERYLVNLALSTMDHDSGPLETGKYERQQLESNPTLQWMAHTWPKLQRFKNEPCFRL